MVGLWAWLACSGGNEPPAATDEPPTPTASTGLASPTADSHAPTSDSATEEPVCPNDDEPQVVGVVADDTLIEASGLAYAGGLLWAHNDSGPSTLYGLTTQGAVARRVTVTGMTIVDLEDIAVLGDTLWLADVGDNLATRSGITLYAVPVPPEGATEVAARAVELTWPDGPRDCETLLADPISGDLLLLSKELDGNVVVARVVDPSAPTSELEEVARVAFGPDGVGTGTYVTGGDVAPDGRGVVVRQYLDALVFPRQPGEAWAETFARPPCSVDHLGEPQGEAVAWNDDGLFFVSEGSRPPLHHTPLSP